MNILQQLFKFLDKHNAQLAIDASTETPELILRIPAKVSSDGTIYRYALEYRLGQQLPQPMTQQPDLLDTDPTP